MEQRIIKFYYLNPNWGSVNFLINSYPNNYNYFGALGEVTFWEGEGEGEDTNERYYSHATVSEIDYANFVQLKKQYGFI